MRHCFLTLFFFSAAFFASRTLLAQSVPNGEAKNLVESTRSKIPALDSLIAKLSDRRDALQRSDKAGELPAVEKSLKIARQSRGLAHRMIQAGENMPAAQLESFKTEIVRIDAQLQELSASKNGGSPPANDCLKKCNIAFAKWWLVLGRVLCRMRC